jgi:hypothetical protein
MIASYGGPLNQSLKEELGVVFANAKTTPSISDYTFVITMRAFYIYISKIFHYNLKLPLF